MKILEIFFIPKIIAGANQKMVVVLILKKCWRAELINLLMRILRNLIKTLYAQPALFTIEYALAKLWIHLGITPDAIVGHSMGEYVAACLAGVFSLEDALKLIATRAKLVNSLPQGGMLAVTLPENELAPLLNDGLSISLIKLSKPLCDCWNWGKCDSV